VNEVIRELSEKAHKIERMMDLEMWNERENNGETIRRGFAIGGKPEKAESDHNHKSELRIGVVKSYHSLEERYQSDESVVSAIVL
jgi:hypothetical protein